MSVDVHGLPPPSHGEEEVQFRRFLLKCFERVEKAEDDDWKRDPVFHRVHLFSWEMSDGVMCCSTSMSCTINWAGSGTVIRSVGTPVRYDLSEMKV